MARYIWRYILRADRYRRMRARYLFVWYSQQWHLLLVAFLFGMPRHLCRGSFRFSDVLLPSEFLKIDHQAISSLCGAFTSSIHAFAGDGGRVRVSYDVWCVLSGAQPTAKSPLNQTAAPI